VSVDWQALRDEAIRVRVRAYAPYSKFLVGAALLGEDGRVFAGCNVENASYGLCICAERNAVFAAVASGVRTFRAIAIVSSAQDPVTPCGACRQVLAEFAPSFDVRCYGESGAEQHYTTAALLPYAFSERALNEKP
jgi:cytidine deaminase